MHKLVNRINDSTAAKREWRNGASDLRKTIHLLYLYLVHDKNVLLYIYNKVWSSIIWICNVYQTQGWSKSTVQTANLEVCPPSNSQEENRSLDSRQFYCLIRSWKDPVFTNIQNSDKKECTCCIWRINCILLML